MASVAPSTPATPATPAKVAAHSTAIICADARLEGDLTFGPGSVVHPRASVRALPGSGGIVFGRDCVVEEDVMIVNSKPSTMIIGDMNVFMVGSQLDSVAVGTGNTFQPRSSCSVPVMDNCTLSAGTHTAPRSTVDVNMSESDDDPLPSFTVVYGSASERRIWDGSGLDQERALRAKHIEFLREVLPKFNKQRPR